MKKLCTNCFYIGSEESTTHGTAKTESALWAIAFILAFTGVFESYLWLPATIAFGVAAFYTFTLYRIKICVCPKCSRDSMIPINTPKAAEIMQDNHIPVPLDIGPPERSLLGLSLRDALLVLTIILVAIMLYKEFY